MSGDAHFQIRYAAHSAETLFSFSCDIFVDFCFAAEAVRNKHSSIKSMQGFYWILHKWYLYPPVYLVLWGVLLHLKCVSLSKQYEQIWLCFTLEVAWEDIVTCSFWGGFLAWLMPPCDPECKKKQVFKMDGWPSESWLWPAVTRVLATVLQFCLWCWGVVITLRLLVRFAPINVQANHINCDRNVAAKLV